MPGTECGWFGVPCDGGGGTVERLWLFWNGLSGTIPPALEDLSGLVELSLDENQLSGAIPAELRYMAGLQRLYVDTNQLIGPVPVELMDLTGLLDHASNFCNNHLFTPDDGLRLSRPQADRRRLGELPDGSRTALPERQRVRTRRALRAPRGLGSSGRAPRLSRRQVPVV